MPLIYKHSIEEGLASHLNDEIDVEAAVGGGLPADQNEDPRSWAPIHEICNGEWTMGGRD